MVSRRGRGLHVELVFFLTDETRKDVSHLFQENLFLKKERQQLLERVASLEGRLSQLITLHATEQVRQY